MVEEEVLRVKTASRMDVERSSHARTTFASRVLANSFGKSLWQIGNSSDASLPTNALDLGIPILNTNTPLSCCMEYKSQHVYPADTQHPKLRYIMKSQPC